MTRDPYESDRYLNEYLLFHYGQPRDLCPFRQVPIEFGQFHRRIVAQCVLPVRFPGPTRGLDIGCAVGRVSFELGRVVDRVLGIDSSRSFIRAARRMATGRRQRIAVAELAGQVRPRIVALPRSLRRSQVEFRVGDAMDLTGMVDEPFHVVAAVNLLCRLPRPRRFLAQLGRLVVPGGQLVLASPYSWLEQYTPRREWLTAEAVKEILDPQFRLVRRRDLPFLIREHRRKYQLVVSEVSVLVRRAA